MCRLVILKPYEMKTIILVSGLANTGKSSSIVALKQLLRLENEDDYQYYKDKSVPPGEVFCRGNFHCGGKTIAVGLSSRGDDEFHVEHGLLTLIQAKEGDAEPQREPDVIVAATRMRGNGPKVAEDIAQAHGYLLIRTSCYSVVPAGGYGRGKGNPLLPDGKDVNRLFAENLIELIKKIGV